jgi:hypothetical protein
MTPELIDDLIAIEMDREYDRINRESTRDTGFVDVAPEFEQRVRASRRAIKAIAEERLYRWYAGYVFDPPVFPCNCKLALPACDCWSRFKPHQYRGVLPREPRPKMRRAGKVLAKRPLYSESMPRWWRSNRYDDDPIVRSHDKAAQAGMRGTGETDD